MNYFSELSQNPDFGQSELEILSWWQQNDIVNLYLHKNDCSQKTFSFIDGPITANGPMGVHHARGRTLKDVFQRYKNSCGFAQRFQNGFDCQGLWVEVEVEKEAGFNSKKDIQNFGLENFTNACLARVNKFSAIQTTQSQRLGMFMDWPNSYYTNSVENNLYIWHFLKTVYQKGWLIKKKSAATWCPRCETGLSQHEQAEGYKEITDTSVFVMFKLSESQNEYVLAWTTTPLTLSANVLLAINTKYQYVKARYQGKLLYLAKTSADRLGLTDYQEIDATSLLNLKYDSLYNIPPQADVDHYLTNWELVDPVEGTGVVHIAPGCGQEDFELGKKLGAAMIAPLDETGHFLEGYGDLSRKYAHNVNQLVFDYLKNLGVLFKTESVTHRYPHCWRCHTKCLFRLEDNWFMKADQIRPHLKNIAEKVNWHPKYAGRRMQNWLDSMEDWMISRKRFYGLALPFYQCSCGQLTVVGSLDELKSLAVNPKLIEELKSVHRPWIDAIDIKCPKCNKNTKRISDVGDVWLDAGIVPFSTLKYLTDKSYWQKWFPANLVLEMTEQIRLWFYSMLFMSVTLEETSPYEHVVVHAEVRDEKGDRMSKTKKNGIPYEDAISKMGADSMRWLYCQQKAHTAVNFGFNIADQVKRDFMLILWNSYRFFTQHANLESWSPKQTAAAPSNILDRWILSRLNSTIDKTTRALDKFSTPLATATIESFVSDLSTWYIRRSRDRIDNFHLLYQIFNTLAVAISPFIPFFAETIYQNLNPGKNQSVHLQNWPKAESSIIDSELEKQMELVRQICQLVHGQRQSAAIKVRQPLSCATVTCKHKLHSELIDIISQETNVKTITFMNKPSSSIEVSLDTVITPALKEEGDFRDFVRQIQVLRKQSGLSPADKISILAPSWPKNFEAEILKKTQATAILFDQSFKIKKNN